MSALILAFSALLGAAQLLVPMRYAMLPLLVAACHSARTPFLGDFNAVRVVVIVGLCRVIFSGRLRFSIRNPFDATMVAFVVVAVLSSIGHTPSATSPTPLLPRLRLSFDVLTAYLYARSYIPNFAAFHDMVRGLAWVLLPLAFFMAVEVATQQNPYTPLGARLEESLVRDGKVRASGPFGTPILAGTAGAVSLPLLILLWQANRKLAIAGGISCFVIVVASASSGPIGTVLLGAGAFACWKWRHMLGLIRVGTVVGLTVLHFIKERPIWYLIALIDFVGGSTGWHRSKLIDSAIVNFSEWWLFGTDYTRHWMPYGLPQDPNNVDLTNYYIHLGVIGGFPLMFCLLLLLYFGFRGLGRRMQALRQINPAMEFRLWCVGAALFAHSITFLTISYFDQMYVLFYVLIGALPGLVEPPVSPAGTSVRQPQRAIPVATRSYPAARPLRTQ